MKSKLSKRGIFFNLAAGMLLGFMLFILGILLLPLAPIFWFLAIAAPFMFLGVKYSGDCPVCGKHQDIRQKSGGFRCRRCKSLLMIEGKWLVGKTS